MEAILSTLLFYLTLGLFAGVMAGLLGVGGGLIIVPALAWIFHHQQVDDAIVMHLAIGTSLATIVVTSISSVRAHHRRGAVLWPIFWRLTPGIVVGAWLGASHRRRPAQRGVEQGIRRVRVDGGGADGFRRQAGAASRAARHDGMLTAGGVIGAVSAIVGIGGGSLTVPFLTWCNTRSARRPPLPPVVCRSRWPARWASSSLAERRRPARLEPGLHLRPGAGRDHADQHVVGAAGREAGPYPAHRNAKEGVRRVSDAGGRQDAAGLKAMLEHSRATWENRS